MAQRPEAPASHGPTATGKRPCLAHTRLAIACLWSLGMLAYLFSVTSLELGTVQHQEIPSIPLRPECLEIVQRAEMVDIGFEDVSGGNTDHPHKGALDEDGKPGYIHNETTLRNDPPKFEFDRKAMKKGCRKRDNHYRMLHNRVVVDLEYDREAETRALTSGQPRPKIFCLVYSTEKSHQKIAQIRQTWG